MHKSELYGRATPAGVRLSLGRVSVPKPGVLMGSRVILRLLHSGPRRRMWGL